MLAPDDRDCVPLARAETATDVAQTPPHIYPNTG